jgi:hypothetical protein
VWVLLLFGLPETLKSTKDVAQIANVETASQVSTGASLARVSTRQAAKTRSVRYLKIVRTYVFDPLKIVVYLKYPPVTLSIYYAAVTFCSLYILNISITYSFQREPYNYSTLVVGLLYIPNSAGYIISSILGGRWMDSIMKREAIKAHRTSTDGRLIYLPEDRMRENAWLGACVYPIALIWYGWTVEKGASVAAPVSSLSFGMQGTKY